MNKITMVLLAVCFMFVSCANDNFIDTNVSMDNNNWTYANSLKATLAIKDTRKTYQIYFKLRHTADYRYANLFVLFSLKGNGLNKYTRYQFKLAKADGEWTGKGSGAIFTHDFLLLSNYRFKKPGVYTIEIEQNMRDNPLIGISDAGILVLKQQ